MSTESRLPELLLRWEALREQGHDATPEAMCADCPEHLEELRRRIAALRAVDARMELTSDEAVDRSIASTVPPAGSETGDFTQQPAASRAAGSTGRYTITRAHARGGLGEVFVAQDTELNRKIALKRIQNRHAGSAESRRRFLVEAEITARLEHPGIVPVYGLVTDEHGQPSYAMRFIEGESLHEAIQRLHGKPTTDSTARTDKHRDESVNSMKSVVACSSLGFRLLLQRFTTVCNTIAYAHSRGVIHRDIKPANVMLGKYGETLVVDWGLAKVLSLESAVPSQEESTAPVELSTPDAALHTQPGHAVGTPVFMSPEQAEGRLDIVGPAADIYSLGATLYVLLTGQLPFTDANLGRLLSKVQQGEFPPPRSVRRGVPAALEAICLKAMVQQPAARYLTALELAGDVERWLADEAVGAHPEPWTVRAGRWGRKHKTLVTSAALAVVLLGVGGTAGVYQWQTSNREQERLRHEHLTSTLQVAEAQEQIGVAALRANRWTAAAQLFEKALEPLGDAPELAELRTRLQGRLARTTRLLRYQQFDQQMVESLLFDLETETLQSMEMALAQFEVFSHARWWDALPDEDLTPRQRELLRLDIHAHMVMFAAMHLRHGYMNLTNPAKMRAGCQKSLEVLAAVQAFEPTLTGDFLEYASRLGLGQLKAGQQFEGGRPPIHYADHMFLGMMHQWLHNFGDAPLARFFVQGINNPHLDLKNPLATSERHLRAGISRYPDFPLTYSLMTETLQQAAKYGEAEFSARTQIALSPEQPLAYRMLCLTLLSQADAAQDKEQQQALYQKAIHEAEKIPEIGGYRWQDYAWRGSIRLDARATQEALADLEKACMLCAKASPEHPQLYRIHHQLGDARSILGRREQAITHYTEALRLLPKKQVSYTTSDEASIYLGRGEEYLELEKYPEALADLELAIKKQPTAPAYAVRARVYLKTDKLDAALGDADRAIRLGPDLDSGYLRRGEAYLRKGEVVRAIPDFAKVIALNPKATLAHEWRGCAHALRGDWDAAAADFREIIRQQPDFTNARYWLGMALLAQGDLTSYRRECVKFLDLVEKTNDAGVAEDVVLLGSIGGGADPARTVNLAERMLKDTKKNRERLALGAAYLRAGRLNEAQACFEQAYPAVRSTKPWAAACFFRALCDHRLGRPDDAQRWVEPFRQWHTQFLAAIQAGDLTKAERLDPKSDWQSRILLEALLREIGKGPAGTSRP